MMNCRYYVLVITIVYLILLTSCTSPYIGRTVSRDNDFVCWIQGYPASCSNNYDDISISYKIEETKNPNEYKISGSGVFTGGTLWTSYEARFKLFIIEDGVVVQVIGAAGGKGTTNSDVTFSRTFSFPGEIQALFIGVSGVLSD